MDPNQPTAPNTGQYDFIVNPEKPGHHGGLLHMGGGNFLFKLAVIIGGTVVFIVVAAIIVNVFFGSKTNIDELVGVAQTQSEVIRVSALSSQVSGQALRNAAESTQQTVGSQQQALLAFLKTHGRTLKEKDLALKKNTQTDQTLRSAQQSNTYDIVFMRTLQTELTDYDRSLTTASKNTGNLTERSLLSSQHDDVQTLLKQLNATQ